MDGAHSTYGAQERCIQGFGGEKPRETDHLEEPGIDGRIMLKWIFRHWDVRVLITLIWLRTRAGGGHL